MKAFHGGILLAGLLYGCGNPELKGPLVVSEENPGYFADRTGKIVYLAGSHTWNNLVDMVAGPGSDTFDYKKFLDYLESYNHNFFRLWAWDLVTWNTEANGEENSRLLYVHPKPWLRTGPGQALDGRPRFDLEAFDPEYFQRLRERVQMAADRHMFVAVMLFEGWGTQFSQGAYQFHPFHPSNNIQDLPLSTADSARFEIYTLAHERITVLQEAYVRKVIETLHDLDNVLYEISNENHPGSTPWQYHLIRFIRDTENSTGRVHPVGMTFQYRGGENAVLYNSPADWISPNPEGGYRDDPPERPAGKVIITDTDHLWGIGGNSRWVWKSFFRGLNPLFMDPYDGSVLETGAGSGWAEEVRIALGHSRKMAGEVDLARMIPAGNLSSSGYCLANPGEEYLVYLPDSLAATLDLGEAPGKYRCTWFNTVDGSEKQGATISGGSPAELAAPWGGDAIVHLKRR